MNLSCSLHPFLPPLSLLTFLLLPPPPVRFIPLSFQRRRGAAAAGGGGGGMVVEEGGRAVRKGVKCVYMCVFVCTAEGGVDMMRLQCCRDGLAE